MRWILALLLCWPLAAMGQSRTVSPGEVSLEVRIVGQEAAPYPREMVMILIRGVYRRHVTLESLQQPDLDGFNWTQLGPDHWREERIRGQKVKVLERRMALFPERSGVLRIGAFTHRLTLTDENDRWFEHDVRSDPIEIEVAPAPEGAGAWWFPARRIEVIDSWSNAPDQLQPGEGVLRIVRVEALGVTPEMIPPMPELRSPSGMIFAHPEKRLVQLSPEGPVTIAFWRWTIRPTNDRSAIVEPISLQYFDTRERVLREVTITAQRVAYGAGVLPPQAAADGPAPAVLPGWPLAALGLLSGAAGIAWATAGRGWARPRVSWLDPLAWRLRRAARSGDARATRRAAAALIRRDGAAGSREAALHRLDTALFAQGGARPDLTRFARAFLGGLGCDRS